MTLRERWDERLAHWQDRYGRRRVATLALLGIAGIASLTIVLLARSDLDRTALLYLAVPYLVSVLITLFRPYESSDVWWRQYLSHSVSALVVFLASSVLLFEGFICVLFFVPIYFFAVTLAFVASWIANAAAERKSRSLATAIPLLVAFLSLEGSFELATFDRRGSVTATATTELPREALLENLATPVAPPASDNWMLRIFPMPHAIEAESLRAGTIHRAHTRYHRWFVANTHEGVLELRIDSVTPELVRASVVGDTTFFSNYVDLIGTEVHLVSDPAGRTRVSLAIHYERRLDPAWYFQPVQRYALQAMATHLIEEVIIREQSSD